MSKNVGLVDALSTLKEINKLNQLDLGTTEVKKSKATVSLFDHVNEVKQRQRPNYWSTLDDASKKTWSNYMIIRFLSMNPDWVELIAYIQPYIQDLNPESTYKLLIGFIPKTRSFDKYVKGKKEDKYSPELIKVLIREYECSKKQANEYCDILYSTEYGKESIKSLCERYSWDKKMITKLKLKLKKK